MSKKMWVFVVLILTINLIPVPAVNAISCPDLKIIFARGSGEKRWVDQNYLTFKQELEQKLKLVDLKYEFEDLDYPAINVANPWTLLSAYISGGESYEFGESVDTGINNLISAVNNPSCPNAKFVVAGYSQGAMVVSKAVQSLNPDKIIYAATFGDPKIYLPEGEGLVPAACKGKNLSNYRIYVPDCKAYEGILGAFRPYQPEALINKMGTWCNKMDILCSSHYSLSSHLSYISDGLYADASKFIFAKICEAFGLNNKYVSLHDTAILIDSTGSMGDLIDDYKTEALRLAEKTFAASGRVALYDYRDLDDPYEVTEHCNFETCTLARIKEELDKIEVDGGGDTDESLLSASFNMMKKLSWKYGSTKSVVVLTDAFYHNPDIDGVGFDDVVALSKKIDPVNFYVIAPEDVISEYEELAVATGGGVASTISDLSLLTDTIIARYDSLPRVEDFDVSDEILPSVSKVSWGQVSDSEVLVRFSSSSGRAMIILNDAILGISEDDSIIISGLDFTRGNMVSLVPISENTRGVGIQIKLENEGFGNLEFINSENITIPKVPNAGKR